MSYVPCGVTSEQAWSAMVSWERGMTLKDRIAIWIAWHLPRLVAEWTYRRVSETGATYNPFDQPVSEPLDRWRRNDPR